MQRSYLVALFSILTACEASPSQPIPQSVKTSAEVGVYCCQALQYVFGSKISYPNSTVYELSVDSYWSNQNVAVTPSCVFSPNSTQDVSIGVGVLSGIDKLGASSGLSCKFAIRSGGHTPWAGAASIEDGVTFDLSALKQVTVSADQKTTSIGAGNRWVDVYSKLDALGLAIPGGRVASVGVGGLITGGGMSFFSPRAGFVCDNVVNFEVVLGSGQIVSANATSNPTLWVALKGGSNNFGVVTRFDVKTFAQGLLWGGQIINPIQTISQQLSAFVAFAGQKSYDVYGTLIHSYAWTPTTGWIIDNFFAYTEPVLSPPVFQNFTTILPQLVTTVRLDTLTDFTEELEQTNPYGHYQLFFTATYTNSLATLTQLFTQTNISIQAVTSVPGLVWALSFQPLPTVITQYGPLTGGNSLGLDPSDGNLVLALLTTTFDNASDAPAVTAAANEVFTKANAYATAHGTLNPYQYLNYAYKTQTPIQSYGVANVAKLKAASKKYDPDQVFQKWVPGGFKLPS